MPVLDLMSGFIVELRSAGLPVSLTENLDAMEAVKVIPIEDRDAFKYALGATLVKNNAHWRVFETIFEVYFSLRGPEYEINAEGKPDDFWREMQEQADQVKGQGEGKGSGGGMDSLTPEEIAAMLMRALMSGDQAMMRALAKQSVQRFAGMEPGRPVGGTYYLYRTLRNLDLDNMLQKLMDANREMSKQELSSLEERLEKDEFESRIEQFKQEVEAEIRRRLVADRGAEAMAKTLRKPLPEDVEFMHASRDEMQNLKKSLQPLTRKLAARLARKRRHGRKGPLDFRNTVRHSLAYGGVPAEPKFKYPRPAKPELIVIADISGSVAAFARFTLMLVYAISGQFSKVRSFVFIDGIDEVVPGAGLETGDVQRLGQGQGTACAAVIDPDQFHSLGRGVLAGMVAAENTGAGDARAQDPGHAGSEKAASKQRGGTCRPRRAVPCRPRRRGCPRRPARQHRR